MNNPMIMRTICGNMAAIRAGIIPNVTSNHNTP